MADDTRRWQRISRKMTAPDAPFDDAVQALRMAIAEVRRAPRDIDARRELRALATDPATREQLALVLGEEVHRSHPAEVAAALYEELADVHENLDQPLETIAAMEAVVTLEPYDVDHLDRLAWLYRRAGATGKAADTFLQVANLAPDHRARAALHAAGVLYRETAHLARAVDVYRAIVAAHPRDLEALRALDELFAQLERWSELAELRGQMAQRASGKIEKAALLRAKARALEQAGDAHGAAEAVARASSQVPDDISGQVDYAMVLARGGRGPEAATILEARVAEAIEREASVEDVASLRLQLAAILEDACGDRPASAAVLAQVLGDMPDYVPALERLVWQASHDADPQAYPAAILRHASALPAGPDKAALLIEAARRFRDARDHRASTQAFEAACELVPDHDLRRELDDERAALEVERALAETDRGDDVRAERRLRALIATRELAAGANLAAVLALADLLAAHGRHAEAVEHLRTTLAAAPPGTPDRTLAPVVHRYAVAVAALDEPDEAHRLFHDAHALDRRDLVIKLALGESCFQRRLWREAALHLGGLADHPDAPRHARAVAAGLVHAALAEVRALRPGNAAKHYEAAVRLDPQCGRAWHQLAELAMERGDTQRGADCLEREAESSEDPKERLRLFDALGDLAIGVLGDAVRAERCWARVVDTSDPGVLRKLLTVQRARGAGVERGETCERLAEVSTDKRERKELAEEAAQAFAAGGEIGRARGVAQKLVAAHPTDLDAVACATAIWRDSGDHARIVTWLTRALAAWDAEAAGVEPEPAGARPKRFTERGLEAADPGATRPKRPTERQASAGDNDPRRAELWRRLGDAERARGDTAAAERAYERAIAMSPDADGALASRRALVELGAGASAGLLAALVEAEQSPDDVIAWARELAREDRPDDARAAYELARALGAQLDQRDDDTLARAPLRELAPDEAYPAVLDSADRAELVDDPDDVPLAVVLEVLGEVAIRVCPDARNALGHAGLPGATRLSGLSNAAAAAMFPQIAKALGTPPTLLHQLPASKRPRTHALADGTSVVLSSPPIVVLGPNVLALARTAKPSTETAELRFELGRLAELTRPRRSFAAGTTPEAFAKLLAGLQQAFGKPADGAAADREIVIEAERLRAALPVQNRRFLSEYIAAAPPFDAARYLAACDRAADRAGLLACGRVDVAIRLAGGPRAAPHLVRLAASPRYLAARHKLRRR